MDKEKHKTPIRTSQIRNIEVVDDADWLKESERVQQYEEELWECLSVIIPKRYNL